MNRIRIILYLCRSAFLSLRFSVGVQIMSIATLTTAFLIAGGVWLILKNVREALYQSKGISHISIYFKEGASEEVMKEAQSKGCKRTFIAKCELISSDR